MAELARGSVMDRPWGRTFATLGLRGVTGQLTLVADGKHFLVAFEHGAVVAAASPLASDAAVRVALTGHLVSSSQVPEISRRLADSPERDEVDVIAELARLGPDHALRLRRRVIAQRAARTFSINHGEFTVTDYIELPIIAGCELDVRAVVYIGARTNLSEQRLSAELDVMGGWFQLKPDLDEDLPQFGFSDVEQPVIERLRDGGTIAELEEFASSFVDGRTVRAVVYALASYNACEVAALPATASGAGPPENSSASHPAPSNQPMPRLTQPPAMAAQARASTQPMPRTLTKPASVDPSRVSRPTPEGSRPARPTPVPGAGHPAPPPSVSTSPPTPSRTASPSNRTVTPPATSPPPSRTASPSGRTPMPPVPTVPRAATPPGPRTPPAPGPSGPLPALTYPAGDGLDDGLDAPTQRDGIAAGSPGDPLSKERSSPGLRPPLDDPRKERSSPGLRPPLDGPREMRSSPGLRPPLDGPREMRSSPGLRPPLDDPRKERSSPGLRPPLDDPRRAPEPAARPTRDIRSSPGIRPPLDDSSHRGQEPTGRVTRDPRQSPGLRSPLDEGGHREADAPGRGTRDSGRSPGSRPPLDEGALRGQEPTGRVTRDPRQSPGLRSPLDEGGHPEADAPGRGMRDSGRSPGSRPPLDEGALRGQEPTGRETRDPRQSPGLRSPLDEPSRDEAGPGARAARDSRSNPALRPPPAADTGRASSSPALQLPPEDGPDLVIRRVAASRPPPARQVARTDSPLSHDVKGLIAQRLKLLDQGADHFQLLGVGQDAPPDAVRKAYFVLARQLHPDRLAALGISDDGKHAQRLFAQINAGFAILSNPARRAHYVDVLRRGGEAVVRAEQARAEDLARRILEAEEAFRRGELALRRDQPEAAVGELELAVQLNPDEADYHALLAWAQFCAAPDKVTVATRTRTLLERAIQRSPRSVTPRFYLGRVERMLGCDKDALRHFRDVLAAAPGHAEAASEVRIIEARMLTGDKPGGGMFGRTKR